MSAFRPLMSTCRLLPVAVLLVSTFAFAQDESSRVLNPLASVEKAMLKGFVEKPLFEPSRHPPVIAAPLPQLLSPPQPPLLEPPPSLRLIGVVEGSRSLAAIVHRNDNGRTETLHPGDHIGTWIVEVMPAGLRVVSGERAFDYAMFRGNLQQGPTLAARSPTASDPR